MIREYFKPQVGRKCSEDAGEEGKEFQKTQKLPESVQLIIG